MGRPIKCPCGSGLRCDDEVDGYGVHMFWFCTPACYDRQRAKFRPDIFERYECDEPIEED